MKNSQKYKINKMTKTTKFQRFTINDKCKILL